MSIDVRLYIEVDTGGKELYKVGLYNANITHNLSAMADEAGIYKAIWQPEASGIKKARDLIPLLEEGINRMEDKPNHYRKFDAPNGWGTYDDFLLWLKKYLKVCKTHPKAKISVWR